MFESEQRNSTRLAAVDDGYQQHRDRTTPLNAVLRLCLSVAALVVAGLSQRVSTNDSHSAQASIAILYHRSQTDSTAPDELGAYV